MTGSASSWTSLAVERRGAAAAVTTVQMTTPPGSAVPEFAVPGSRVPGFAVPALRAGRPGCSATAAEAAPYLPL